MLLLKFDGVVCNNKLAPLSGFLLIPAKPTAGLNFLLTAFPHQPPLLAGCPDIAKLAWQDHIGLPCWNPSKVDTVVFGLFKDLH